MIPRLLSIGRLAALLLLCGLAFGTVPASADGYRQVPVAAAPVVPVPVAPPPCGGCYQPCGCCGCVSSYYLGYYPAYTFPTCCGYGYPGLGFGFGYGYGYDIGFRYGWGPRRYVGPRAVYR